VILYRVAKLKYAQLRELAQHGFGAAQFGARWNSPDPALRFNRRIIYTSDSLAQAMLEVIVHTDAENLSKLEYGYVEFQVNPTYIAQLDVASLPENWNSHPATTATQHIGDAWFDMQHSPILRIPSVITPFTSYQSGHANYLINATHPDIEKALTLQKYQPMSFDPRIKG
jgi:RES domain-containing protein